MGQRKLSLQYYMNHYHTWRRRFLATITLCLAIYWYMIQIREKGRKAVKYAPILNRDIEWESRLNRLFNGTEAHCISELRMRKVVFHKLCVQMQELFANTSADSSLAADQDTCMNHLGDFENDDSHGLNDMGNYALPEELADDDSDTLPSPLAQKNGENNSSSTNQTGAKRPRGNKSPSKKQKKPKSRFSESTEQLNSTLVSLQKILAAPAPQVPPPPPSHTSLWERLEAMTITTDDKIAVGQYLAHKEREGLRDFLSSASETTLQTWIYKFLTGDI